MEPIHVLALGILLLLLTVAATLEIFGTCRLTVHLHNLLKREPSDDSDSQKLKAES